MEEVEQIELETKPEEAKQVPRMPNGALQNENSSPDSGHPSSRNFSITSGLSEGSFSTEDSSAPDASHRPAAAPQTPQSSVKAAGGQSGALTVAGEEDDKGEEEGGVFNVTKTVDDLETEAANKDKKECVLSEREKTVDTIKKTTAPTQSKHKHTECPQKDLAASREGASTLDDRSVKRIKESDKSSVAATQRKDNTHTGPGIPEDGRNPGSPLDTRASRESGAVCASQKDAPQVMTDSDESPSAIEMEEIPTAKVSMVPWSSKGHCEPSSQDSNLPVELRQEGGKVSPEGSESVLSEPEMESLYPPFDAAAKSEDTKDEATSGEVAGSSYRVCTVQTSIVFVPIPASLV